MSTTIYGISNCDTVKKARRWLDDHAIEYRFHDFRKDGLDKAQVEEWLASVGAEILINKRGTTFRQLSDSDKKRLEKDSAIVLCEYPALIKRPVLTTGKQIQIGFSDAQYQTLFRKHTL
jgi:arsenate reductase